MSDILSLAPEIITLIALYLEVGDIVSLGKTCTGLRWVRFEGLRRLRLAPSPGTPRRQWGRYIRLAARTRILETLAEDSVDMDFIRGKIEKSAYNVCEIVHRANLETIDRFLPPDLIDQLVSHRVFYLSALKNRNPAVRDHFVGPALEKHPNILAELVAHCTREFTVPVERLTQERLTWVVHAVRAHVHPDQQHSALLRILSQIGHGNKIAFFLEIAPLPLRNVLETVSTSFIGWKAVGAHYLPLSRADERLVRGAVSSWFEDHRLRNIAIAVAFGLMEDTGVLLRYPGFVENQQPHFYLAGPGGRDELRFRAVGTEGWPEGPVETWEDDRAVERLAAREQLCQARRDTPTGWCTIL